MYSATEIINVQSTLESARSGWDSHCEEVGKYVLQRQQDFFTTNNMEGLKRNHYEYDSTANIALNRFAAALDSLNTPRTEIWHRLQATDPELQKVQAVKKYYDDVNSLLFRARYSTRANFAAQNNENYAAIAAWGMSGIMVTDDMAAKAIRYKSCHVAELYVLENQHGLIDTIYRKFELTAKQAVAEYGNDRVSSRILSKLEREPGCKFWFIHCITPNQKYIAGSLNVDHYRFKSVHVEVDGKQVVREGGFRTLPLLVDRYVTAPGEVYGRSVAMMALADIKTLNAQSKTGLVAGQKAVDPPLLLHDDGVLNKFMTKPGALNYGGVNENGQQLVQPLQTSARLDHLEAMMQQRREAINDAFYITLFQILVDNPQQTATEAMIRAQEKGVLLGPTCARRETECLGPMIERELDILSAAGQLPEMPPELVEAGGIDYEVYYTSPLARAQRAEQALGMQRTVEQAVTLAGFDPAPLKRIDLDFYIKEYGDSQGCPARLFKDDETVEEEMQADKQQQQMAALAQAAPSVAGAVKDIAQAQALGGGA